MQKNMEFSPVISQRRKQPSLEAEAVNAEMDINMRAWKRVSALDKNEIQAGASIMQHVSRQIKYGWAGVRRKPTSRREVSGWAVANKAGEGDGETPEGTDVPVVVPFNSCFTKLGLPSVDSDLTERGKDLTKAEAAAGGMKQVDTEEGHRTEKT